MTSLSKRIDTLILNRMLGIPMVLAVMYLMFLFAIQVGGPIQALFDNVSRAIFMNGLEQLLLQFHTPHWVIAVLAQGVGQGINTTFTFIPVISALLFALSFLESSGIVARVAFVMDKTMQLCGLPGKSFVSMVIGFGCNVPAIMSARTLDNQRERILTIMMSPFMSCGARLAIFVLFASVFFPTNGQNIIFGLYVIGIVVALLTGLALKKTILMEKSVGCSVALPPYRWPSLSMLCRITWNRSMNFLYKAGLIIIPVCALMGGLGAVKIDTADIEHSNSIIAMVGKAVTPLFAPMGIQEENWPATVGLLTGILAKEVVVGTLNTLYTGNTPINLVEKNTMSADTKVVMVQKFGSTAAAFAYLLFVLLYVPCISVVATMAKELNKKWALFSVVWTTGIAYTVAVFFYQSATITEHPVSSLLWIFGLLGMLGGCFYGIRVFLEVHARKVKRRYALPTAILVLEA